MTAEHTAGSSPRSRPRLERAGYLADEPAALVAFLAQELGKPILIEGPAGVGKTELAKALSRATGRKLIRLQCYEGLDESKALYEWNYRKQLLHIQAAPNDPPVRDLNPRTPAAGGEEVAGVVPTGVSGHLHRRLPSDPARCSRRSRRPSPSSC